MQKLSINDNKMPMLCHVVSELVVVKKNQRKWIIDHAIAESIIRNHPHMTNVTIKLVNKTINSLELQAANLVGKIQL